MSLVTVGKCHADLSNGSLINYVLSVFEITPLILGSCPSGLRNWS